MGKLARLKQKLQSLQLLQITTEAIQETKEEIVTLNIIQMNRGIDARGSIIRPPYSRNTVARKRAKGQPADRVTLRDTGAFQGGMNAEVQTTKVVIDSTDSKAPDLEAKYGDIFGLSDKYQQEYMQTFKPAFFRKIRSKLL